MTKSEAKIIDTLLGKVLDKTGDILTDDRMRTIGSDIRNTLNECRQSVHQVLEMAKAELS